VLPEADGEHLVSYVRIKGGWTQRLLRYCDAAQYRDVASKLLKSDAVEVPIYVQGPYSCNYPDEASSSPLLLIGGGTGITPLLGLLHARTTMMKNGQLHQDRDVPAMSGVEGTGEEGEDVDFRPGAGESGAREGTTVTRLILVCRSVDDMTMLESLPNLPGLSIVIHLTGTQPQDREDGGADMMQDAARSARLAIGQRQPHPFRWVATQRGSEGSSVSFYISALVMVSLGIFFGVALEEGIVSLWGSTAPDRGSGILHADWFQGILLVVCVNVSGLVFAVAGGGALHAILQGVQRCFQVTAESSGFGTSACDPPNSNFDTASVDQLALLANDELNAPLPSENETRLCFSQHADRSGPHLEDGEIESETLNLQLLQAAESAVDASQV
jgi:hypothetical protein